jgi:hypothetical protein
VFKLPQLLEPLPAFARPVARLAIRFDRLQHSMTGIHKPSGCHLHLDSRRPLLQACNYMTCKRGGGYHLDLHAACVCFPHFQLALQRQPALPGRLQCKR